MEKEFIPYEESLALKKLGFDEPCFGMYGQSNQDLYTVYKKEFDAVDILHFIKAPLYQQAFKWFREKYKLEMIRISPLDIITYYLTNNNTPIEQNGKIFFITGDYLEEAELACLKKLIEIVKNKKNG